MKIISEIKIEGFQNFEQFMRIKPINIRIIDPEIQIKLMFFNAVLTHSAYPIAAKHFGFGFETTDLHNL